MSRIYAIFSVVGWAWTLVVLLFLLIKLGGKMQPPIEEHEKRN
jgi:hypothetical protein